MMGDFTTIAISSLIQGLVGLLIWFAVQRSVEKVDRLEAEVRRIKDEQLKGVIDGLELERTRTEDRFRSEAVARKGIHEEMTFVRTHFVHVEACAKIHAAMASQMERFTSSVIDLAKIQERTEETVKRFNELNQRMISFAQDLARMEGLKDGRR